MDQYGAVVEIGYCVTACVAGIAPPPAATCACARGEKEEMPRRMVGTRVVEEKRMVMVGCWVGLWNEGSSPLQSLDPNASPLQWRFMSTC